MKNLDESTKDLILGTIGMVVFFTIFFKGMWIASALGLVH